MAVISPTRDALVIRIVYDGPPMAGKTTSIRTLAAKLGGTVHVPAEISGRTLYFDWLDYTGGLFEGRRIRCQIVSVPGQASLASRRRRLLASADAVVFVCDSTRDAAEQAAPYLLGLRAVLARTSGPAVGVVVQANKRDAHEAVPLEHLRAVLDLADSHTAVVESIATDGAGIREAFVFAVRLALDRVREMMKSDRLAVTDPDIDTAEALLADLRRHEGGSLDLAAQNELQHARASGARDGGPALPTADLPGGTIWPPVQGRILLHELTRRPVRLERQPDGDWSGRIGERWIIHSPASGCFRTQQEGRAALLDWARAHSACAASFAGRRCIVLAEDGAGTHRLWQFVETPSEGTRGFSGLMPHPAPPPADTGL